MCVVVVFRDLCEVLFLFCIYKLPLAAIIKDCDLSFHCYSDDTQIYFPLPLNYPVMISILIVSETLGCGRHIFIGSQYLKQNKLEILLVGTKCLLIKAFIPATPLKIFFEPTAKFKESVSGKFTCVGAQ